MGEEAVNAYLRRHDRDRRLVDSLADALRWDRPSRAVLAVPMYGDESCLGEYLASVAAFDTNVCVLVNGPRAASDESWLRGALVEARAEADAWNERVGRRFVSVHAAVLPGAPSMGRVRRVLCDGLVAHAARRGGADIIICNDVDQLEAANGYVDEIVRALGSDQRPVAVAGPVLYGNPHLERSSSTDHLELALFNEVHAAINRVARSGGRVWPEGANLAFTTDAYCEAGGFDPDARTGEDDAIGAAFDVFARESAGCWEPVQFAELAWTVTSPRRVLAAIHAGRTGIEAWVWRSFFAAPGAGLDAGLSVPPQASLLTSSLLARFNIARRDDVWSEVTDRVGRQFFRSVVFDCRTNTFADVQRIAAEVGIELVDGHFDRAARDFEAVVDWSRSSLLARLAELGEPRR